MLAGNAVIPTIDAACRLAGAQAVPLLISGGVGHSTGYLYEAVRQIPVTVRCRWMAARKRMFWPTLLMTTGTSPIRGWWWRTSQPTAVRTPVLPGPRWRAGGSPIVAGSSFRTRLCSGEPWLPSPASGRGDDAAAVVELSRLLAGAGADRWPTGVRGRRSGALAGHPLPGAAAGRAAAPAGYPEGYGPREKTSSAMSPSRRRSSTPATAAGGRPACRGPAGPHPRLKNARLRQIRRKRAICVIKCNLKRAFWPVL